VEITIAGAFLAGLLSFVSPCVLPLVPPYLCFIAGVSLGEIKSAARQTRVRILFRGLFFVAGFSLVFVGFGVTASALGRLLVDYAEVLTTVSGAVLIVLGLHFLGFLPMTWLYRDVRFRPSATSGFVGAFVVGLAFAFGWTPCVGPILAGVLFIAADAGEMKTGIILLSAYAAGIGIPFVLSAAFVSTFLNMSTALKNRMKLVQRISGMGLIVAGILFITGMIQEIGFWLNDHFPALSI
jgi:cytochrome c-type biogenesis protein